MEGFAIPPQNACLPPVLEGGRRPGIDVFGLAIPRQLFPKDDPDQVIRTRLVVPFLHGGGDFVVGLGHNLLNRNALGVIAPGPKWRNSAIKGTQNCSRRGPGSESKARRTREKRCASQKPTFRWARNLRRLRKGDKPFRDCATIRSSRACVAAFWGTGRLPPGAD